MKLVKLNKGFKPTWFKFEMAQIHQAWKPILGELICTPILMGLVHFTSHMGFEPNHHMASLSWALTAESINHCGPDAISCLNKITCTTQNSCWQPKWWSWLSLLFSWRGLKLNTTANIQICAHKLRILHAYNLHNMCILAATLSY